MRDGVSRHRQRKLRSIVSLLIVAIGIFGLWRKEQAQGQPPSGSTAESSNESRDSDEPSETARNSAQASVVPPAKAVATIEDSEPKVEPTFLQKVDKAFATAVDAMAGVLFYRLGATDEFYVEFTGVQYYVRSKGSKGDFQKLTPDGLSETETISPDLLEPYFYRKALVDPVTTPDPLTKDVRYYRLGEYDGKTVEYLKVKIPAFELDGKTYKLKLGDKLVQQGDVFLLVGPMRGLLDESVNLTRDQVQELSQAGWIKTDTSGKFIQEGKTGGAPVVVLWLALGAVFFTLYMKGVNFWGFSHAVEIVRGKYDNPDEAGEVTHFQALMSALSATVGLGNIAGVTIAMTIGGPGAFFWMICCGLFGMTSKFTECTLGQKYRTVKPDGTILGGPMGYLKFGLAELGLKPLGVVLSLLFTVMCVLASFGGGNMFQINQSGSTLLEQVQYHEREAIRAIDADIEQAAVAENVQELRNLRQQKSEREASMESFATKFNVGYGLIMAILTGMVIIGGIKRIGAAAEKIVPTMCLMYVAACLWIILTHFGQLPELVARIFTEAFSGESIQGGLIGVLVIGVQRAAFSNEAGVGSAAIAHSAAKTEEPVREGAVALLGPFIDTIIVCSMTALVILITDAWRNDTWVVSEGLSGAALTSRAFGDEISWFPWVLSIAVVLFAFSTVISWSYYGERCWETLFGARSIMAYKILCVTCVFVGAVVNAGSVLDFSDMMILSMAFPNILGVALLSPKVRADLADYWKRYKAGEFKTFK